MSTPHHALAIIIGAPLGKSLTERADGPSQKGQKVVGQQPRPAALPSGQCQLAHSLVGAAREVSLWVQHSCKRLNALHQTVSTISVVGVYHHHYQDKELTHTDLIAVHN